MMTSCIFNSVNHLGNGIITSSIYNIIITLENKKVFVHIGINEVEYLQEL